MGAHVLGGAMSQVNGYNGSWTPGRESRFDNELYILLREKAANFVNRVIKSKAMS